MRRYDNNNNNNNNNNNDNNNDRYHGQYDDEYSRRGASARASRYDARNPHDYDGMYDDGYQEAGSGRNRTDDERYHDGGRYRDDGGARSRSPSGSYRNRSRSHSPTRDAGKPTDTIIFEGLPFSVSSNELRDSIMNNSIAAEFSSIDVRVSSSRGHRRAFVQFQQVDHAVALMRDHFPKFLVQLTHSTDDAPEGKFEAYIHYARSRDSREEPTLAPGSGNNWVCPTCDFSNYSTRSKCKVCGEAQVAPVWQQSLTGVTDAADVPSQILVVYPLAPFVNEDMLANDIKRLELTKPDNNKDNPNGTPKLKSTAPSGDTSGYGARPGSLHRVFLIRDTNTDESFKYGFAEFWTVEDAAAAVTKFQKLRSFSVAACPATVSNTHMGVFVPEDRETTPATERMSFHPLFNTSLRVRYRDPRVYASQQLVTEHPPQGDGTSQAPGDETADKKTKKRKADGSLPASSTKKSVPMAGQMAMWQRKRDELRGEKHGNASEASDPDRPPIRLSAANSGALLDGSKSQGPIKISLSGVTKLGAAQDVAQSRPNASEPATAMTSASAETATPEETSVSFVDRERLMCLICMRKYKSVDEVNIHERSRNHKTATENEEQVKAALPRLAARDKRLQKQTLENTGAAPATSQYRDRAKERRTVYNQPTKPTVPQHSKPKDASKKDDTPTQPPPKPAPSKGAGMLAKMGWSTGAGLGANGEGATDVIVTNAYQEGVGLGASGGNLGDAAQVAERRTKNSYTDYVNTVQDKARERYNQMG